MVADAVLGLIVAAVVALVIGGSFRLGMMYGAERDCGPTVVR